MNNDLLARVRAAAAGDRQAARDVIDAIRDDVYRLALRMLGHPADAEDAAQEILIIVLTHLGSFRGDSALSTWVWRIAANHLQRVRRGRRETITFDVLGERLQGGLREEPSLDPERELIARELRLRCTEAMLLSLDRDLRIAYVLGDIFGLAGDVAADVLEIEPAAYRKRLSRARERLYAFVKTWCGVYAEANPCRCAKQVDSAIVNTVIDRGDLYLIRHPSRPAPLVARAADEVTELFRVAEMLRDHPDYEAPAALSTSLRELIESDRLELLRS